MMKKQISIILFILFVLNTDTGFSQNTTISKSIVTTGITFRYGLGQFSLKDEYISKEKYAGSLPYLSARWTRFKTNSGYHLGFGFRHSSTIKNNNVSADIIQFSLNQDLFYSLPKKSLFNRDLYTFLGPAMEFFFYYNKQNIAVSGFDYSQSFAGLISLGIYSQTVYPILDKFQIEISLRISLVSLGLRMVDSEEEDVAPAKLLSLLRGTNVFFNCGFRYYLFPDFSLKIAYGLNITRISSWDPLLSASDNFLVTATYGF